MTCIPTLTTEDTLSPRSFSGSYADITKPLNSAVSWGAIAAGAAAAASLSLILLILGVGLGLSSVSPWSRDGVSATTFGVSTILWLTLTQLLASAMGGYIAGRLRTKWTDVSADEVYFRDTAHGFLAWAVASLATAALLTTAIGSILNSGVQAGATASERVAEELDGGPMGYFVDSLFRRDEATAASTARPAGSGVNMPANEFASDKDAAEVSRIFMNVRRSEPLPSEDLRYVGQIVAKRTGRSQQEAQQRVTDVYAKAQVKMNEAEVAARDAVDKARKASAYSALWLFVSLLIGAFVASVSATFGGRLRDA